MSLTYIFVGFQETDDSPLINHPYKSMRYNWHGFGYIYV
jgi:hypothetical protein